MNQFHDAERFEFAQAFFHGDFQRPPRALQMAAYFQSQHGGQRAGLGIVLGANERVASASVCGSKISVRRVMEVFKAKRLDASEGH